MAMSVVYGNFAGRVVSVTTNGAKHELVRDTLGSVAAVVDQTGTVTDRFEYWPYGEIRSRIGSSPINLDFVGTLGYFRDAVSRLYIRARILRNDLARWMTVDPLWPKERAYGYVDGSPSRWVDPSGRLKIFELIGKCGMGIAETIGSIIGGGKGNLASIACTAGAGCLAAILATVLALWPPLKALGGIGDCIAGALASGAATVLEKVCDTLTGGSPFPNSFCLLGEILISALNGCIGNLLGGNAEQAINAGRSILSGFLKERFGVDCGSNQNPCP